MTPIIDIFFPANGISITIINLFQVSLTFQNDSVELQVGFWKFGGIITLIKSEDNLCHVTQEVKKQ